jgi:acetoin utilization deacetylase AcuC-like enzyme
MPLHVWSSDHFTLDLPRGHAFPAAKYAPLRARLVEKGVVAREHVHASDPAPRSWLASVHADDYLERALGGSLSRTEQQRLGLPWSEALVLRARAAVFGTVMAARAALEHGVAGNLAGGSHHAFRDRGEGYCLFHDFAIAIVLLMAERRIVRPLVIDLDVHQGNGTAAIFDGDPRVFTFSMHGARNYPLRKERSSLDVELHDRCDDETYLRALDEHLPALDRHRADAVFYQAGVDALAEDRFGRLALTRDGLRARDERVFAWCAARGLPVVITLGGGYARPIELSIAAHAQVFDCAARPHRPSSPISNRLPSSSERTKSWRPG